MDIGRAIVDRVAELGRHSDSPDHYTRMYLTPAHRAAARRIAQWMEEAGMQVHVDAVGSVIGRYEGAAPRGRGTSRHQMTKTLLLGSHFDSVRNGGKYDGVLGILVPIACVAELARRGERLPVAVEVAAFADEEGTRFHTSFLASRALIGRFERAALERRDNDGISLADAMATAGLDPANVDTARIDPASLAAYVEVHIEQGPVLLDGGHALGVVTSIAAGLRHTVRVKGEAGHAGTVPMPRRRDALAAAAEMVLAVEQRCAAAGGPHLWGQGLTPSLVGTVGILRVKDGSSNVIPGDVEFTIDIRAADGKTHLAAQKDVFDACEAIARRRGVAVEHTRTHEVEAVPCAPWLQDAIAASIERTVGGAAPRLPSGAGHDAMVLAEATDVGMMFVRCGAGGVSHNPAETVSAEDADLAARALLDFLRNFATRR